MIKQISVLTIINISLGIVGYVLNIFIANKIGPTEFGKYSLMLVFSGYILIIVNAGTDSLAPKWKASGFSSQIVFNRIWYQRVFLFILCVFTLPMLVIVGVYEAQVVLGGLILACTIHQLDYLFEIEKRNIAFALIYALQRLIFFCSIYFLFSFYGASVTIVLFAYLAASLIGMGIQYVQLSEFWQKSNIVDTKVIIDQIQQCWPLLIIALFQLNYGGASRLFVESRYGVDTLGVYSLSLQFMLFAQVYCGQANRLFRLPLSRAVYTENTREILDLINRYIIFVSVPICCVCGFVIVFTDDIVYLLFDSVYEGINDIMPIIAIISITTCFYNLLHILWVASDNLRLYATIHIVVGLCMILMMSILPTTWGLKLFITSICGFQFISLFVMGSIVPMVFRRNHRV